MNPSQLFQCTRVLARVLVLGMLTLVAAGSSAEEPKSSATSISDSSSIPTKLAAYQWVFVKAYDADGQVQTAYYVPADWPGAMSLGFTAEGHGGIVVCNSINWKYTIRAENGIQFNDFYSTAKACFTDQSPPASDLNSLMSLESRVSAQIRSARSFALDFGEGLKPPMLRLVFADNSYWDFGGKERPLTPSQKYGDDKERLLFEVEAKREPCDTGKNVPEECMRVREVQWGVQDGKGLLTFKGPWQLLALDAFEGFAHQPGWHTLEYVDKYRLPHGHPRMREYVYVYVGRFAPISAPPRQ